MPESLRDTIARVAREEGIDPAYALAVAERESDFNPNASGTGTIRGLYQMTGRARREHGLADNASPEDQTRAFARFTKAVQGEMRGVMGRDPTPEESYLGHHFGGVRGGRAVAGHYNGLAPGDVFSPLEMRGNPHFGKAGSMDDLARSIKTDIGQRRAKFGAPGGGEGGKVDFAQFGYMDGDPASPERDPNLPPTKDAGTPPAPSSRAPGQRFDFAQFGLPEQDAAAPMSKSSTAQVGEKIDMADMGTPSKRPGTEIDLTKYGQPMPQMPPSVQAFAQTAPGGGM